MKKVLLVFLAIIFVFALCGCTEGSVEETTLVLSEDEYVGLFGTGCPYVYLSSADGNDIIAANSVDEKMYPASMTKIMTFIVAYEHMNSLEDKVTISKDMKNLYPDASRIGIDEGDIMSVEQLMYGLLLESDTDCALALAEYTAGSEDGFVVLMNEKAAELGLVSTRFANATGLHHEEHYTTPEEMAEIFAYALKTELFRTIITTDTYVTYLQYYRNGSLADYRITFYNTTISDVKGRFGKSNVPLSFGDGAIIGGKTGYTDEAEYCLALLVRGRGGDEYILITAGASTKEKSAEVSLEICSEYAE